MQQITVGARNQIVIPLTVRKKIAGFKPGRKVSIYAADQDTVVIKASEKSWLEDSYGAMKRAWRKTSPLKQTKRMRDEWDEK